MPLNKRTKPDTIFQSNESIKKLFVFDGTVCKKNKSQATTQKCIYEHTTKVIP